jgi:protein-S-isoprenylcysteine O-methyltransferase Ste14
MPETSPDTGPGFRLWPPVSIGVPLLVGLLITWNAGDPWGRSSAATTLGWVLLAAFALWAVVALPVEWALLRWGAVLPEERYLEGKFGAAYTGYRARVRRWL